MPGSERVPSPCPSRHPPRQPWSPCVLSLVLTGLCCLVPFLSEESFHLLLCLSPSSSLWHLENSSPTTSTSGFLGGSVVKNPSANAGDAGHVCSIPGSGRSPGERNGNPLQCSCLENSMDRGAWQSTVHGVSKSQT